MANITLIMLFIVYVVAINTTDKNRRLVLHSDTDIVTELNNLRTELNDQKTVTQNLNIEIQSLTSEIGSLKTVKIKQDLDIHNLTTTLSTKLAEKDTEIQALKTDQQTAINNITSKLQSKSAGSSYVRWGKNGCPVNGTSLAYSGFMAGSLRSTKGGTSNYLCLSGQPTWDYYEDGVQGNASIYGVEYEFTTHHRVPFFGSDIAGDNAPCAVCYTTRATNIMIPGRNTCYDGWTKEYNGYIVTDDNRLPHGTEYICLDRRPDIIISSKSNDDENILYFVEASCGKTLECPPYVHGRELTCVVCSK